MSAPRLSSFIVRCGAVFAILVSFESALFAQSGQGAAGKEIALAVERFERRTSGSRVSVSLSQVLDGKLLFEYRGQEQLTPASVLKLVTSVVALRVLGPHYRWRTEVYAEQIPTPFPGQTAGEVLPADVGNLYFRGYGDPSFINERLWDLIESLKRQGVGGVRDIIVDDSLFVEPPLPAGENPYEAGLSATSLNYNSYLVEVSPALPNTAAFAASFPQSVATVGNSVMTVEGKANEIELIQRPTSAGFSTKMRQSTPSGFEKMVLPKLSVTVRGKVGVATGPVQLYQTVPLPSLYFGTTAKEFLIKGGINVSGDVIVREVPDRAKVLRTVYSRELGEILRDLNHVSNNFIAGQLLYTLGQDATGYFRQDVGRQVIAKHLTQMGIEPESYAIFDGSGLDRRNKISTAQLVKIMLAGYQDFRVGPDLVASLARFGKNGTVKRRTLRAPVAEPAAASSATPPKPPVNQWSGPGPDPADTVWAKTGTLDEVSSVAGFLVTPEGQRAAYAIIINGPVDKGLATELENTLVKRFAGIYSGSMQ